MNEPIRFTTEYKGKTGEFTLTIEMIARIIGEWIEENPGVDPRSLSKDELMRRLAIEIELYTRILPEPSPGGAK